MCGKEWLTLIVKFLEHQRRAEYRSILLYRGIEAASSPVQIPLVSLRTVYISALSILIACASGVVARALTALIGLITNLSFLADSPLLSTLPPEISLART